jgi:alanine racemase
MHNEEAAMFQGRWAWAEIDLDAIAHNTRALKGLIGAKTQLLAIMKSNAYGHGVLPVARSALNAGATWLGVNLCDEGVQLRQAGIKAPILTLGYTPATQAATVVANRLTPTINTIEVAAALNAVADPANPLSIHIKVDTGLSRFGMMPDEIIPFAQQIAQMKGLRLEGLFTHYASADAADKTSARKQLAVYMETLARLQQAGISIPIRHTAASGAVLDMPEARLDMVRCGIALYGLLPSDEVSRPISLRPALSLKARIARLRTLPVGTGIGYGATFVTTRPTLAALLPIGYADGVKRGYSNKGVALVHGQRVKVLGRVSMDQMVVDVSDVSGVAEGDETVLIGRQGNDEITCDEMAALLGTINYEVVVGLAPRLPRVYLRDGKEVGYSTLVATQL